MRRWTTLVTLMLAASCFPTMQACPSRAGEACDPRHADCPKGYVCALAEICTHACEQSSDCWIKVTDGCRTNELYGMKLPDGGVFTETATEDGFCPDSKLLECVSGYCQEARCLDGGCEYDLYGPSEYKGNRDQGPGRP